jgi:hypothetical protein
MKFYRLRSKYGKHFLSPSEEDMKDQVECRNEPDDNDWFYEEIEIPDKDIGICWNNFPHIKTPSLVTTTGSPTCSVGMVRIERSGKRNKTDDIIKDKDDFFDMFGGGCSECPYFISQIELDEIVESHYGR